MVEITAREALDRLIEGNRSFVADREDGAQQSMHSRRTELVGGQHPFAIVLGCSDSRVPAEIVFGQGLGDLFVIRVAGNIVAPSQVGSIEFAVAQFGSPLVVVLGHSNCGAISATLDELALPSEDRSRNLWSIVDRIRPTMETVMETCSSEDREELVRHGIRANVRASANQLRHSSRLLEDLTYDGKLWIVGAEYSLETGVVDFFDGIPT